MRTASQTILHLLDFLLDFRTPFFFLLSLSLRLSLLSSISELAMLSGSLLLSLPPVLSWSTTPLEENIFTKSMFVCPAICWLVSQLYFSPGDCSHACDGGLAEQSLVLFELPVPLVRPDARLRCSQVPVPTTDDVSGFEISFNIFGRVSLSSRNLIVISRDSMILNAGQ